MGSSAQLYSLSWGEFSTSLTSAVQLLRGHGDLVDVTLAAGGRTYPAHKIVLSAASPFLLNLLKSTPCEHPVVLLAGVSSDDLESLLEFVYKGEVSVEPSQLPSLLQAAHCLGIHGLASPTILTENGEEVPPTAIPTVTEPVTREIMNSSIPINRRKKRRRKSSSSSGKWAKIDTATDNEDRHDGHGEDDRTTDCDPKNEETSVNADDDGHSKGKSVSDQPTKCPLCGAILRQSRNLRRHLELLHFGAGNNNKPSVRIRRRKHDFQSPTMVPRIHQSQLRTVITNDNSDFSSLNPLSLTSTVNSLSSNFPGNILTPGSEVHPRSEPITAANPLILGPPNNGLYSSENSASMLNLLPNLPSLSTLPSPHDVFLHEEMLRAGAAYHDSSRQHIKHMLRENVT
ncbi:uncharacterized protein LOC141532624 isoform X2 [Cotesia typhae]|uniref:uncharacterized protein LOC141532624 isoform X2 n=1 Tax=Cotesia typhae TaxID=2053667 RepID=UPI003D69C2A8